MMPPTAHRPRRFGVFLVALALVVGVASAVASAPTPVVAQTDDDAAARAAREIQAARDRANAAAEAFFAAQSELALLEQDAERLSREAEQLELTVERLRADVESVAVSRFMNSGASGIPLLTGLEAPQDQIQAEVFVDVLTNTGSDALDQFDIAQKQLAAKQDELERQRYEIEQQQDVLTQLQDDAEAEVERLREIEEQRLKDEAVRKALEAQQAADWARLEEALRRQAEAAARAQPNPGAGIPPTTLPPADGVPADDVPAADGVAADGVPADGVPGGGGPAGGGPGDDGAESTGAQPGPTAPPVSTLPTNSGASGGTSGGRTGTAGSGSSPLGIVTGAGYIDNIICPMPGSAYGDSWGAPRSGGRRHQGVDMLAPTGIPIFAVVSGYVTFKQNRLGGNAVSLAGDNGNRYYYAHLSRYEGVSRRVEQGEVIGYNGDTGNATGVPHLHFEIHPGGGLAVNPTPSVRAAGC